MLDTAPDAFDWMASQVSEAEPARSRWQGGNPAIDIGPMLESLASKPEGRTARELSAILGLPMNQVYRRIRAAMMAGKVAATPSPSMGKIGNPPAVVRLVRS